VVECTALEMRHRCKPIGGSNPSLSATLLCFGTGRLTIDGYSMTTNQQAIRELFEVIKDFTRNLRSFGGKSRPLL
jgi:hypothetical protein